MVPGGQSVEYTYHWANDQGVEVTHGPTTSLTDILEANLPQAGEMWTITVTPNSEGLEGPSTSAIVEILNRDSDVDVWVLYP